MCVTESKSLRQKRQIGVLAFTSAIVLTVANSVISLFKPLTSLPSNRICKKFQGLMKKFEKQSKKNFKGAGGDWKTGNHKYRHNGSNIKQK